MLEDLFDKYKKYLFHYKIKKFGTADKYIPKTDKAYDFHKWIYAYKYKDEPIFPKTTLTEYLFGDEDYYHMVDRFNEIDKQINKKRHEHLAKLNKGKGYI